MNKLKFCFLLCLLILPLIFVESIKPSALELELRKIPGRNVEVLFQNHWNIIITDENIGEEFGFDVPVSAITDYNTKTIYVKDNRIEVALLHEIGHVIDYESDRPSNSIEFQNIYDTEKYRFIDCTAVNDQHEISNTREYFASVYQNILINYETTKNNIPKTVQFIEQYME